MKTLLLATVSFLIWSSAHTQSPGRWTAFWDERSELRGFKDSNGDVRIKPKFMGFTVANEFEHIMAAMEEKAGSYETYYLTRSGKKVGVDSLYIDDNSADCESEGFIRFRDKTTDKVGMFGTCFAKFITPTHQKVNESYKKAHLGRLYSALSAHLSAWAEKKQSDTMRDIYFKSILFIPEYFKYSGALKKDLEELYKQAKK